MSAGTSSTSDQGLYPYLKDGYQKSVETIDFVRFAWRMLDTAMTLSAFTALVMFKRRFGERFLCLIPVLVAAIPLLTAAYISGSVLAVGLTLIYFMVTCLHRVSIVRRNRRGEQWHSRYQGDSWLSLILPISPDLVETLIEPLIVVALAWVFWMLAPAERPHWVPHTQWFWAPAFSLYLLFVAISLVFYQQIKRRHHRNILLDAIDNRIANEHFAQLAEGRAGLAPQNGFGLRLLPDQIDMIEHESRLGHASSESPVVSRH